MARLTVLLSVLTALIALLGGFRYVVDTLREYRWRKRHTGKWLIMAVLLASPSLAAAACLGSSPAWTAADTSRAEVDACVAASVNGDTINVPAGSSTWASGITIAKQLTIQGAGLSSTHLDGNVTFFTLAPASDLAIRITGIDMSRSDFGSTASHIAVTGIATGLTQIRVDHCQFTNGGRQIFVTGWAYGVIDNNIFLNGNISVGFTGDNNAAWDRTIVAGTSNAMFVEDNTFTMNDSAMTSLNEAVYMQEGARVVARYNTFDGTARTADDTLPFDSHGNQNYYTGSGDFRGQPIVEFYNNTVAVHHTYRMMHIRSGSLLIHDNAFTTVTGTPDVIVLSEEEYWQTAFFSPLDTTWPDEDQINNSFFWSNTLNGSAIASVALNNTASSMIQEDRDYFMHAPQASGGSESYTGRAGASGRGADGTLEFTAAGANKYYPYTPYTYPHPLRSDQGSPDSPILFISYLSFVESFVALSMLWHARIALVNVICSVAALCPSIGVEVSPHLRRLRDGSRLVAANVILKIAHSVKMAVRD